MDVDTQTHLPVLRNLLEFRVRDLRADLHASEMARELAREAHAGAEVFDLKEQAAETQQASVSSEEAARMREELQACEFALKRLDEGRYGDCFDCDEPIPLDRLMVQPAALRCAPCQQLFEQRAERTGVAT